MKSEFDKGYEAGRFQAYQDAKMIFQGRIDRIEPGKDKRIKEALEGAMFSVLHHLRSRIDSRNYPDCVDKGPDGKCTAWLIGDCEGPKHD